MASEKTPIQEQTENICAAVKALAGLLMGQGCDARVDVTCDGGIWEAEAYYRPRKGPLGGYPPPADPFGTLFATPCVPPPTPDPFLDGALHDLRQRVSAGLKEAIRLNQLGFVTLARAVETLGVDPFSLHGFTGDPTASWPDVEVDATFGHVELRGCSGGLESIRLAAVGEGTPTARLTPLEARRLARVLMLYADTHQDNEGYKVDGEDSPSDEEGEG